MLHYDDADNALIDLPIGYGYYYSPVSILGVAGAQVDATKGKWDARAQFANSSPANPRSLLAHDQYGNWAGGAGFTIRQGFRVGVSAYRGPYLDRQYAYFFPGEANPSTLSAHALGLDVSWAHGHTSATGEVQNFVMPYKAIPDFRESTGYGEIKQGLSPRWYVAVRSGFSSANASGEEQILETSAGFRPNRLQLIKIGYEYDHYSTGAQRKRQCPGDSTRHYFPQIRWARISRSAIRGGARRARISAARRARPWATEVNSLPPRMRSLPKRVSKMLRTAGTNELPPVRKNPVHCAWVDTGGFEQPVNRILNGLQVFFDP